MEKYVVKEDDLAKNYSSEIKELKKNTLEKCRSLWSGKKFSELVIFASDKIGELPVKPQGDGDKEISEIFFLLASAMLELGESKEAIYPFCIKALHFDRVSKAAQWLLRELNKAYSDDAQYFNIETEGMFYYEKGGSVIEAPFVSLYAVIASNPEEALEYIKEFERPEITAGLKIIKSESIEQKPDLPKGVYKATAIFYAGKDE